MTGASSESKRKEESSEEEEARKEAFTKEARKEAYTKAQSMKSLFQQGQTIKTKRYEEKKKYHNVLVSKSKSVAEKKLAVKTSHFSIIDLLQQRDFKLSSSFSLKASGV